MKSLKIAKDNLSMRLKGRKYLPTYIKGYIGHRKHPPTANGVMRPACCYFTEHKFPSGIKVS